ncbi:uncharacterized protein PAC_16179 [Phialocephala subalpina]|uniref:Protein kinase domain-containing protein n=1 Tax=Phialocephala subalpina TaxID=576137 RepID=A0A1L7XMN0_9HELO|nr:uncharacterized protein PAC_16179 [Phialocephala subalpina]
MADESEALPREQTRQISDYETETRAINPNTATILIAETVTGHNEEQDVATLLRRLEYRSSAPVTSISSFMALVTVINPSFKPRTLHRPWSISAGSGQFGTVEVHRYVPGRNFDVFNNKSQIKLHAYTPDVRRTGEYYAVKRLTSFTESESSSPSSGPNPFSQFADELRILANKDLHGHPNLLYLFGVSHSPSRSQSCLAELNLVLQEGDCGDLYSFYRDSALWINQQTLVEIKMSLCFDISVGLETLHRHGVVHCDLKPKNILIRRRKGRDGKVASFSGRRAAAETAVKSLVGDSPFIAVLADFGGSLIFSDTESDGMRPKVWTPFWSAPECYARVSLSKELLPKIDIYAAGLIFAFILLEGRDIFTQVVHHGALHSEDTTLDAATIKDLKLSDGVLDLAKQQVRDFETVLFALYADGSRVYHQRETMYADAYVRIFHAILEASLHTDSAKRVRNATEMMKPWKDALRNNFHLSNSLTYQEPDLFRSYRQGSYGPVHYFEQAKTCVKVGGGCCPVPSAFPSSSDLSPGVFDVRKAFRTYRASLTSGLKTEILNDLLNEVNIVQSIQQIIPRETRLTDTIPPKQLNRAADCAYQIGLAHLEGFGIARNDVEAMKWIRIAAEWGSPRGQADYLPIASGLDIFWNSQPSQAATAQAMVWTVKAIAQGKNQAAAAYLGRHSPSVWATVIKKYRQDTGDRRWSEFEAYTGLSNQELFGSADCTTLRAYFTTDDVTHVFAVGNRWPILHYAILSGSLPAVKLLVEDLKADVRFISSKFEMALDIAIYTGNSEIIDYLLTRHEMCRPHFRPGSFPLHNIARLEPQAVAAVIYRILTMADPIEIDAPSNTARTALMNIMITEEPLHPESRRIAAGTLLAFGANPLLITDSDLCLAGSASPLFLAVQRLDLNLVKEMIIAIKDNEFATPFRDPSRVRPGACYELARAFFKIMQTPRSVRVTSGVASFQKTHAEMIKLLIKEGIASELPNASVGGHADMGPLGMACYYGNDEAAAAMLDISSELTKELLGHLEGTIGLDTLLTAVNCGFADTIDILLARLVERDDIAKYNVLVSAVHHQPTLIPKIYSYFERAGKGPLLLSYVDPWGATALDTALEYELFGLAKFLLSKGASYDEYRLKGDHSIDEGKQSTLASVLPRMKPVKFLMELTPKPSLVVTESGLNVFHILALDEKLIGTSVGRSEFLSIMDYFYALDPSLIHARGGTASLTPFHICSVQYSEIVANFLHRHGADINALSGDGDTPLDVLEFHDAGDRPPAQRLTIDYSGDVPQTGLAICDYALAGPAYWVKETKMAGRIRGLYLGWGARRSVYAMLGKLHFGDRYLES